MSVDVIFKIFLPDRALGLTERTRGLRDAFHELKVRNGLIFSSGSNLVLSIFSWVLGLYARNDYGK